MLAFIYAGSLVSGRCGVTVVGVPLLGAFAKLRKQRLACRVCPSTWNNSSPTEHIFMEFDI
jgi:hypothetical protein